jgi:hypothetical protein
MRIVFRNTKLSFTKHWGAEDSVSIIRHFRVVGHSVPNLVRKVIGMGISTSSPEENKGHYPNLDDFQEICEDSMLIHNGEMMAIILHAFVPSTEASEHIQTLRNLFRYGGTMLRTCSPESQMALFGHRFCRGDLTVDRSVLCNQDGCSFKKIYFTFFLMAREFLSFQIPAHQEKKCGRQRNLVARATGTVCGCLGHIICADKSASVARIMAKRVGRGGFAIWHLSSGKKLFHSHGGHGELPVHTAY